MNRSMCVSWRALAGAAAVGVGASLASGQVVVDGDVSDWPLGVWADADGSWLRLLADAGYHDSVVFRIDADADASTGRRGPRVEDGPRLGIDMEIRMEPRGQGRRGGTRVVVFHEDGSEAEVPLMATGFHSAPTHASVWREVRIGRSIAPSPEGSRVQLPELGLRGGGSVIVERVHTPEGGGDEDRVIDRVMLDVSAPETEWFAGRAVSIPEPPGGGLRVMAWNVLWGSQKREPEAFERVLDAVRPDVILFQEWDRGQATEATIESWLDEHAAWGIEASGGWSVSENDAWGVAVATPYEMVGRAGGNLYAPGTRWDFPVRLAAASVDTPIGVVAFGSTHLKCCGGLGTEEDDRRLVEAIAVNETLGELADATAAEFVVLGGDFNMNGSREVLDLCRVGLDADGSVLEIADARVLGDTAMYTFGLPETNSNRPRLDYITYSGTVLREVGAFVLDTTMWDEASLEGAGLERVDTAVADHLPVVVDLMPVRATKAMP
ncbi:MAG: endonuclease/exonuclease/phosphatase family protein [Planctomycetota bacterium]